MVVSWTKCVQILIAILFFHPWFISVQTSVLNDTSLEEVDFGSSTVIGVTRGRNRSPDSFNVCSQEIERVEKFTDRVTMDCNANVSRCSINPRLQGLRCICKSNSPTYIASKQDCVNNGWLRTGCAFRFGSWQFSRGWRWLDEDNPLLHLSLDYHGITGGFNASTKLYESCSVVNITILNKLGNWETFQYDPSSIIFFKLHKYFHISWATEKMSSEMKRKLRGRLARFFVSCVTSVVLMQGDSIKQDIFKSCLTFKITGNRTYEHSNKESSSGGSGSSKAVAISLGVVLPLLFIVGIVCAICCYRRRHNNNCPSPCSRNCLRLGK